MGMSASQVRLLSMTARVHDIENEAQRVQNQKMLLANQSDEAYEEYLNALEQKNIQAMHFNPATGTFDWDEVGIEGLYDNGYALKVQGRKTDCVYSASSVSGLAMNTSSLSNVFDVAIKIHNESNFATNTNANKTASNSLYNIANNPNNVGSINDYNNYFKSVIEIGSAAELIQLANYIKNDTSVPKKIWDRTIILKNDISFDPGQAAAYRQLVEQGVIFENARFLGNGHTIKGLMSPLFTDIRCNQASSFNECVVQDVKFDNSGIAYNVGLTVGNGTTPNTSNSGMIAMMSEGNVNIDNCYITDCKIGENNSAVVSTVTGGLIGTIASGTVNISDSAVSPDVTVYGTQNCGGFVGNIVSGASVTISDSNSSATLGSAGVGSSNTGGFVGKNNATLNITDSFESFIYNNYGSNNKYALVGSGTATLSNCALPRDNDSIAYNGNSTVCDNLFNIDITITTENDSFTYNFADPSLSISSICDSIQTALRTDMNDQTLTVSATSNGITIKSDNNIVTGMDVTNEYVDLANVFGCPGTFENGNEVYWKACSTWEEVFSTLGTSPSNDGPALLRNLIANAMAIICTYTEDPNLLDDNGNPVKYYTETSVSVDTHLREMQNDKDMAKAEANYEAALRKIDQKDKKFDKELAALDNERKAVTEQMETFKTCIKENLDRTMKVFNG